MSPKCQTPIKVSVGIKINKLIFKYLGLGLNISVNRKKLISKNKKLKVVYLTMVGG